MILQSHHVLVTALSYTIDACILEICALDPLAMSVDDGGQSRYVAGARLRGASAATESVELVGTGLCASVIGAGAAEIREQRTEGWYAGENDL